MKAALVTLSGLIFAIALHAQYDDIIALNNPSFEEIPHQGGGEMDVGIRGWFDCGQLQFPSETPPDIHPVNAWKVTMPSSDGKTYLGMVVRDIDSWESVTQRLKQPLEEGKCYSFSIDLARSEFYESGSRITQALENYTEPAVLRIWGGTGVCGRQELLGESVVVNNTSWQTYEFEFEPGRNVNYFTLEAFYEVPVLIPYNGHLLLDNASSINQIPCDGDQLLAVTKIEKEKDEKPVVRNSNKKTVVKKEPVKDIAVASPVESKEPKKTKLLEELDAQKIKKGQTIRIENLYFSANKWDIEEGSDEVLDEIFQFLKENRNIVVEIGGHTSTPPPEAYCYKLSSNRAKQVALFLVRKGISPKRLKYKGYGKEQPLIKNDKHDMAARAKNQRVEIKILSVDYSEATGSITNPKDFKSSQNEG